MRRLLAVIIMVAVAALWVAPATTQATDQLAPGKIFLMKPGKLAKVILKPIPPAVFLLPAIPNNPIIKPWGIWWRWFFFWIHITFPPVQWKGLGNPAGSKGYKYKGAGTMSDPCKVVLIKPKIIKAVCKGDVLNPDPPHPTSVPIQIGATDLSDRYCAEFGGTDVKNDSSGLKRKDAPAPIICQSPSGAFVDDSSSSLF